MKCKNELEGLLEAFRKKLSNKKESINFLKESIQFKEQENALKEDSLLRISQSAEELKKKLKKTE